MFISVVYWVFDCIIRYSIISIHYCIRYVHCISMICSIVLGSCLIVFDIHSIWLYLVFDRCIRHSIGFSIQLYSLIRLIVFCINFSFFFLFFFYLCCFPPTLLLCNRINRYVISYHIILCRYYWYISLIYCTIPEFYMTIANIPPLLSLYDCFFHSY